MVLRPDWRKKERTVAMLGISVSLWDGWAVSHLETHLQFLLP